MKKWSSRGMRGWHILDIAFYVILALLILLIAIQIQDVTNRKPTKDMLDLTYAVQMVGQEKTQVKSILGQDAQQFKASGTTEMATSLFIADRVYKLENRGFVDVRLQYEGDSEDALLEKIIYFLPFETKKDIEKSWEWVYKQQRALEKYFGTDAICLSRKEMSEEPGERDVLPGNNWLYEYPPYMSVTVAADGLMRVELCAELPEVAVK
ncbi:MAG: hypothetical protein IJ335_07805 [Lachnospiraceae bacterium]|nr:hypothetical protein [Lachnospiraceae bacterium]